MTDQDHVPDDQRSRRRDDRIGNAKARLLAMLAASRRAALAARRNGVTPRGAVLVAVLLVAGLVWLHVKAQDGAVMRHADVLAQLATVKLIDARWDVAVLRSRVDARAPAETVVRGPDVSRVQRALDAAFAEPKSNALRSSIADLKGAYAEKAQLVSRFQQAAADSRQALDAAMRADATVSGLVRSAWRDFPDRERLVAAENLVARVLADAQQYHHTPHATHRAALEGIAADLADAHSLPRGVEAGLARLESDVHQLLLLKPLEQVLGERLTVLDTGARADALAQTFQRDLNDALTERSRYRAALVVYSLLLIVALCWIGTQAFRRYKALAAGYLEQRQALERLRAHALGEPYTEADTADGEPDRTKVRFIRRP